MRIVYIFNSLALKGGMERILCDKMNYLLQHCGYDISFVSFQQGNHPMPYKLDERIKVIDLNTRFCELHRLNPVAAVFRNISLRRQLKQRLAHTLKQIKPDIVVCTTTDFYISECILDLPYHIIVESHIHMAEILEVNLHKNRLLKLFCKMFDHWHFTKINKAATLITLTQADKQDWEKHIDTNIKVIPNIVTHYPKHITPYSDRPNRIVCVGRLTRQKGFDLLIEAWNRIAEKHKSWRIDISGHGELEKSLNKKIREYSLEESIKINKPTDHIYDEYENSAFYVLSSRYEGFALVLVEAMSCGTPAVSFDCPHGPSGLIEPNYNGLLVPLADIEKLAEAMEWMITHKEERQQMSLNAREKAKNYTAENIMPQWTELFESIARQQ